jgi:enoyl-CoA hydratase
VSTHTRASLRIEPHDGFAEVVLTGPGKGNALGPELFRDLPAAIAELDADASVRAIVLRGDGAHFTYGLDLMAMAGELGPLIAGHNLARERTGLLALIRRLQDAVSSLANARAPVINAIHGWCIGGGLDLATACDVRLCSSEAKFSVREVRVAIVADLGTLQRLPRIVGQGHARQLALTGEDFDAARALRIGLVNEVHETPEALFMAARAMARRIAENPPLVVQGVKRILDDNDGQTVAEGLRHVALWNSAFLQSNDLTEAFSAFAERRPPKFEGH